MNSIQTRSLIRLLSTALAMTLVIGAAAPAMASALGEARPSGGIKVKFSSQLAPMPAVPAVRVAKAIVPVKAVQPAPAVVTAPAPKAPAPLPAPPPAPVTQAATSLSVSDSTAPVNTQATTSDTGRRQASTSGGGIAEAKAILARYIRTYPILQGTTIEFGDTQGNPQAIAYYMSGRIVVNPKHTVSLERIIDHEIWHIIDWRDNGKIDWGEKVPPANANDFKR